MREGNQRYIEGKWDEAEKEYHEALNVKNNLPEGVFNLGDVAYQKQDYQKAAEQFETAAMLATDNQQKAKAYHNLGNSYLKAGQLEKSIEAYKNALRANPGDMDTKYNLAYAQQQLKKNPQQQQNQEQNQENKEDEQKQDKQEQNQQSQNQEQQSKEQQQKEGEKKEQQSQQEQQAKEEQGEEKDAQQQQGQPRQAQLSKEDAQRLLEALMQQEQKVQQQLINKKLPPEKKTTEKDW